VSNHHLDSDRCDCTPVREAKRSAAEQAPDRWYAPALVFLALAVLCNAIAYHELTVAQQNLVPAVTRPYQPGSGPMLERGRLHPSVHSAVSEMCILAYAYPSRR
jgi:hypothetical protein